MQPATCSSTLCSLIAACVCVRVPARKKEGNVQQRADCVCAMHAHKHVHAGTFANKKNRGVLNGDEDYDKPGFISWRFAGRGQGFSFSSLFKLPICGAFFYTSFPSLLAPFLPRGTLLSLFSLLYCISETVGADEMMRKKRAGQNAQDMGGDVQRLLFQREVIPHDRNR
ncbi:hypothetical protein B0I35DRAFT_61048 [Stachybotrys elegans]|uniref:Secreted protein n=1 Tax=Stachybotrys elegans TaxID=80388 RepID=A0A8K0WNY0_9HYPO|nr:hypothetical protein B0I35DRAFT_61048 [Stachybotrys elegans]